VTRFKLHQDVAVVECDPETARPAESGRMIPASVERDGGTYILARLDNGALWTFTQDGGVAATEELSRWRLVPICERCEDPILGEPVIHPAGPGHIYCGSDCEDAAAEAWHELHYREA
jgi:hypothetical protein